jgi:hypothetical protein
MGLFVFFQTHPCPKIRGDIPTLEELQPPLVVVKWKKNLVVRVNLSCTAMKPLDYLGFLVDLPPVAWVFTNPIQSWEWPCWVLVKGQRLGPSLKHEPRMSFSRKWWVRVPDSHPRNEYVWGYIGYFTKQIGHVCTGNHPPRQRIINIVKWPKCEMHLNATLMSPNLGNKKIVYRQNITDTSNIYIYIRIHT